MFQALIFFYDEAEILSAEFFAFKFCQDDRGNGGFQNVEGLLRVFDDDYVIAVLLQERAHGFCEALIGLDSQDHGLRRESLGGYSGGTGR